MTVYCRGKKMLLSSCLPEITKEETAVLGKKKKHLGKDGELNIETFLADLHRMNLILIHYQGHLLIQRELDYYSKLKS